MQCYNHDNVPAVAICLACGKALCKSCSHDAGGFIVCSDTCKSTLSKQRSLTEKEPRTFMILAKWLCFVGLIVLLGGCLTIIYQPELYGLGIFLVIAGLAKLTLFYFIKKYYASLQDNKAKPN